MGQQVGAFESKYLKGADRCRHLRNSRLPDQELDGPICKVLPPDGPHAESGGSPPPPCFLRRRGHVGEEDEPFTVGSDGGGELLRPGEGGHFIIAEPVEPDSDDVGVTVAVGHEVDIAPAAGSIGGSMYVKVLGPLVHLFSRSQQVAFLFFLRLVLPVIDRVDSAVSAGVHHLELDAVGGGWYQDALVVQVIIHGIAVPGFPRISLEDNRVPPAAVFQAEAVFILIRERVKRFERSQGNFGHGAVDQRGEPDYFMKEKPFGRRRGVVGHPAHQHRSVVPSPFQRSQ